MLALLLTLGWRQCILAHLILKLLVQVICMIPVGAKLWKSLQMTSSLSVALVSCPEAPNRGQFFVQTDMWVHFYKFWFKLQVFMNLCRLFSIKEVTTYSPAWALLSGSRLSFLSWAVFLIFLASPSGQCF